MGLECGEIIMSTSPNVLIDFSEAGLDLDRAALEEFLLNVADEMKSGNLLQDPHLARESDIPDAAKSATAAFLWGILTAEVNKANIRKVIDFLGHQFYGKTLSISGEIDGMIYDFEYRNQEDLDRAVDTIERLSNLRIKILEKKTTLEEE